MLSLRPQQNFTFIHLEATVLACYFVIPQELSFSTNLVCCVEALGCWQAFSKDTSGCDCQYNLSSRSLWLRPSAVASRILCLSKVQALFCPQKTHTILLFSHVFFSIQNTNERSSFRKNDTKTTKTDNLGSDSRIMDRRIRSASPMLSPFHILLACSASSLLLQEGQVWRLHGHCISPSVSQVSGGQSECQV